jgi:phage tail protein X
MATVYSMQGDTVDALCWRHLGVTKGVVEMVMEMNPGLSLLGLVLPDGTPVDLPEQQQAQATVQLVNLFD